MTSKNIIDSMNILFKPEDVEDITHNLKNENGNKLSFKDLVTVILTAFELVIDGDTEGETETPATT